jgi:hypothetical protein
MNFLDLSNQIYKKNLLRKTYINDFVIKTDYKIFFDKKSIL